MKNIIALFVLSIALISCGEKTEEKQKIVQEASSIASETLKSKSKMPNGETKLCKVDGVDWGYTKGSGIITADKITGKRSAIFTFSRKVLKKKETIQVEYDTETNEIVRVLAHVIRPNKEGIDKVKMFSALKNHKKEYTGNLQNQGKVNVGDSSIGGSGSAQFCASDPYHDFENKFDEKYRFVEITDLEFKDVGFSDLARVKKKLESMSAN